MDGEGFDRLTRILGNGPSRRHLVRGLLAVAAGVALGGSGAGGAAEPVGAAGCVALGKSCRRGDRCCDGRCKDGKCRCKKDGDCPNGRFCDRGDCRKQLDFGASCDEDNQCKSGVCDRYFGACVANRFACDPARGNGQCKHGACCPDDNVELLSGGRCLFQNATPRDEEGCLACGSCAGGAPCCAPARCEDGECCCPAGVDCTKELPGCGA